MPRLLLSIAVLIIFVAGMVTQRYYGLGNLLKVINPDREEESILDEHKGNLDIFILAGQSNMEGAGGMKDYNLPSPEGIYVFNENYLWVEGKAPIRKMVGPSMSFASEIKSVTGKGVGIINVARGGTNIEQWSKSLKDNSLYQGMLKRALASSSQGKIKALLFFQGENDTEGKANDHIDTWHLEFETLLADFREDVGNDSLPVIYAQIGKGSGENWNRVKSSQQKVISPLTYMIKTDDLPYQENTIHFTTSSYIEIGKRFAEEYLELQD